jgi:hypothetical protein
MNWDMLSAIGEILSSVAVLVTLIYLAIQTRQNTDSIRASTRQSSLAADQDFLLQAQNDPELHLLRYKRELTDEEKVRLSAYWIIFVRLREVNWFQYKNGVMDEETWSTYRSSIVGSLGSSRGRTWWMTYAVNRKSFDPGFTSVVSELLADAPVIEESPLVTAFEE